MSRSLRVFQALEASANAMVTTNRTWYRNLHEPLLDLGHEVVLFPAEAGRLAMWRKDRDLRTRFSNQLFETFLAAHKDKPFDLFFSYLTDGMIDPSVIDRVRDLGVPTCNFSCNNAHQFHLVTELSRHFDFALHSERDVGPQFRTIEATPLWWPMAANPKYFHPYAVERNLQVSFVGANYGPRARYLERLLENGIDVYVAGPGWRWGARTKARASVRRILLAARASMPSSIEQQARASSELAEHDIRRRLGARFPKAVHGLMSDDDLVIAYSRSEISLGVLDVFMNHDPSKYIVRHLHLREFEAPMSGALYCTGYLEELEEFFEPDKEVIVYRDGNEMLDKIRFYLSHPTEANAIRAAGLRRALADHTYQQRFRQLFTTLGLA
jgi:spore maturation protein CgeB